LFLQIQSVFMHVDSGEFGGHYYTYIRDLSTNNWHLISDQYVKVVSESDVIKDAQGKKDCKTNAFALFYISES